MAARAHRYVNDHGDLFRMTETKYRRYLLAGGTNEQWPDAAKFGSFVGNAVTVTKFKRDDFHEAYNEIHRAQVMDRDRRVLSVACPTCEAPKGESCDRMGDRFERTYYRGSGASTRDAKRKIPHESRARAAERQQIADDKDRG